MRLEDVGDYFELRRMVANPWRVLRFRKTRKPDQTLRVEMLDGPPLHLRGGFADFHMFHRIFLRDEYRLGPRGPRRWRCIVDLGANVGLFAVRASMLAERVIALEPSPENFAQLTCNSMGRKGVEPVQSAIAGQPGTLRLYRPTLPSLSGAYSPFADRASTVSDEYDEVPSTTLDELFRAHEIEACELVKIDIEGMEYEALQSASAETLGRIQRIHGEYHELPEARGGGPDTGIDALERFLVGHGFGVERVPHRKKAEHGMFFASRPGAA